MSSGTVTYPGTGARWGKDQRGLSMRASFTYAGPGAGAGGYATGGDPITAQQIKLGTIEYCPPALGVNVATTAAVIYQYNASTGKIQAFWQTGAGGAAALPEVDAGTDLSGFTAQMVAEGRG